MSTPQNPEKFLQRRKKQIVKSLRLLSKAKCLITGRFNTGKYSFITVVIDVILEKDLVVLDYGHDELINRKLLIAPQVVFIASYNGIKVRFSSEHVEKSEYKGETVFVVPIPESLYWLERREFYRVKLPFMDSAYCKIRLASEDPDEPVNTLKLRVVTIGITGFSLFTTGEHPSLGEIGTRLSDCSLILPEHTASIELDIRHMTTIDVEETKDGVWIGCAFVEPTQKFQSRVMQYMQLVERQRKEYQR